MTNEQQPRSKRFIEQLVPDICDTRKIGCVSFCADWTFRLQKDNRVGFIFGYDFGLNSSASMSLAKDKAATSEILTALHVPVLPHTLVHHPQARQYVPEAGNWKTLLAAFEAAGEDLVCKPNDGSGGADVFRARTVQELEEAVTFLLSRRRSCCVSPYVPIDTETRVIVLRGKPQLVYEKEREQLIGDGQRTVQQLLAEQEANATDRRESDDLRANEQPTKRLLQSIPGKGETIRLNWRHNLGRGSFARLLPESADRKGEIEQLAVNAANAIGIQVGAVDVVRIGSELQVLEINSGVMMESFCKQSDAMRDIATEVYDRIICAMLGINLA